MDSMRSLNRSLPSSSPKPKSIHPPEELLQSFKAAALSVTNLYKRAASDQTLARQAGYQDALDNLLTFLDKENLGLGDGEGWKVRQWATERLDGSPPVHANSDSDEERVEPEKRSDSLSPMIPSKSVPECSDLRSSSRPSSPARPEPVRTESAPQLPPLSDQQHFSFPPQTDAFTFRSSYPYTQEADMQPTDAPSDGSHSDHPGSISSSAHHPTVRVEFVPRNELSTRNSRTLTRHGSHPSRHSTRLSASNRSLGTGAGSKRKSAFGEFFDISSLGDSKDGSGGSGKRSRLN